MRHEISDMLIGSSSLIAGKLLVNSRQFSHVAKRFNRACGCHVQPTIVELNPPPIVFAVEGG